MEKFFRILCTVKVVELPRRTAELPDHGGPLPELPLLYFNVIRSRSNCFNVSGFLVISSLGSITVQLINRSAEVTMSLSLSSLKGIPVSFATCSIGCRDDQTLPQKINALAAAGFTGIELSMPDLTSFASMHLRHEVGPKDFDDLCTAARVLKAMCDTKEITIMLMQPFANFEGWAEGSEERKDSFERVEGWIKIMLACGCETLQVSYLHTVTGTHLC